MILAPWIPHHTHHFTPYINPNRFPQFLTQFQLSINRCFPSIMPIKRSRTDRSADQLENAIQPVYQQSSSAIGDRSKAARRSTVRNNAVNLPVPPPPPQRRRPPLQIKFKDGGGFTVLPPASLDSCNYCFKSIPPDGDRYMNGGLEAYCSPLCRGNFDNMTRAAAGNRSGEPEPSMDNLGWNKNLTNLNISD